MSQPQVAILMGSDSDWPVMEAAAKVLDEFGVGWEAHPFSAHRSPELVREHVTNAPSRGIKVFIAGASGAAHLAGAVAAHTTLPVIGVPIQSKLKGIDSLLSTMQMPKGVPVATVAIDSAGNAAILAIQILAVSDPKLQQALGAYKKKLVEKVRAADQKMGKP